MMEGFGQTETTMTLGTFPWMTPKPGSMGIPNAQYDIDLLRADGTSCEDGEKGEIVVRVGDKKPIGLFKGYYRDEEKTREAWHDGIYHTGAIGSKVVSTTSSSHLDIALARSRLKVL